MLCKLCDMPMTQLLDLNRYPLVSERLGKDPGLCRWFALCVNEATRTEPHPTLGDVKICDRCTNRLERLRTLNRTPNTLDRPERTQP